MYNIEGQQEQIQVSESLYYVTHSIKVSPLYTHTCTHNWLLAMQYSPDLVKLLPSRRDKWELFGSHFKVGTKLGEGNFGQVYKGTLSRNVAMAPVKKHILKVATERKSHYTVAIKLLKGAL